MKTLRIILSKLSYLLESRRTRQEFDEETESHIAMLTERFMTRGMTREEALSAARRQFGNRTARALSQVDGRAGSGAAASGP